MAVAREIRELNEARQRLDEIEFAWLSWLGEHLTPKQQEEMQQFQEQLEEAKAAVKDAIKRAVLRYPDNADLKKIYGETFWAEASPRSKVNVERLEQIIGKPVTEVPGLVRERTPEVNVEKLRVLVETGNLPPEALDAIELSGVSVKLREGAPQ